MKSAAWAKPCAACVEPFCLPKSYDDHSFLLPSRLPKGQAVDQKVECFVLHANVVKKNKKQTKLEAAAPQCLKMLKDMVFFLVCFFVIP